MKVAVVTNTFTCVLVANQMGSDSPLMPVPVHVECWERRGGDAGYTRVYQAKQFVVRKQWEESLPSETPCYLCQEVI